MIYFLMFHENIELCFLFEGFFSIWKILYISTKSSLLIILFAYSTSSALTTHMSQSERDIVKLSMVTLYFKIVFFKDFDSYV